ncbi:hypothetical protein LAUMK191_02727 [Mycobacterium attenuatum]|uniref:Uncharacterized protein n=1 Tax=Mycobacterium attenuatum TaxID=2341086 RepID=A0A498PYW7_9MYCO|nr:hypothetical protein [Mycobacterium attenuatum]VBA39038.1 hypothetical protein LAUMK136_02760 [Mycobacterium attenuatum]VBA53275.1 hypothetical protein LAUMK191_02727 [Mycobacterium attenuatum]VBA58136.1 hypothetical protein LAUMK41_02803 [Mycobacterium attenuatum]
MAPDEASVSGAASAMRACTRPARMKPAHRLVGNRLDHDQPRCRTQPGQVLARELDLRTGTHLACHIHDAGAAILPTGGVFALKSWRIEAVDRQRDLTRLLDVEQGTNREDVDDAAITPAEPVEPDRLDEQRQRDGHMYRACHRKLRMRTGPMNSTLFCSIFQIGAYAAMGSWPRVLAGAGRYRGDTAGWAASRRGGWALVHLAGGGRTSHLFADAQSAVRRE